jgi:hypothetical protein
MQAKTNGGGTAIEPLPRTTQLAPREPSATSSERPIGAIVTELYENTEMLIRNELSLGLKELEHKSQEMKTQATRITAGGALLYTGLMTLVVAATVLLWKVLDLWLAAAIVGVALCVCGYLAMPKGKGTEAKERAVQRRLEQAPTLAERRSQHG